MRQLLPLVAVILLAGPVARADGSSVRKAHIATLATELQLDASTAERVQSLVDKYKTRMAPLQRADAALVEQLHTLLLLSTPDAQRMKWVSGTLVKNRQKLQSLRDDRLHELQKTLTPEQFARLLVRWPTLTRQFHREALRLRLS
jgi:Spy/CpxP family protein refolding chaperone